MQRRFLLQAPLISTVLLSNSGAGAQGSPPQLDRSCLQAPNWKRVFGDEGYNHDLYHEHYKRVFAEEYKCHCGIGECRQTIFRETLLGAEHGFDVYVNRGWYPLHRYKLGGRKQRSTGTRLVDPQVLKGLAPQLMEADVAHV